MASIGMAVSGVKTPKPSIEQRPLVTCGAPGTWKTGQVITASAGVWNGKGTITISYQWLRDGAAIGGQVAAAHTLVQADESHVLSCAVTATSSVTNYGATTYVTASTITIVAP